MNRCEGIRTLLEKSLKASAYRIILHRYGLVGQKKSLSEMGEAYGLSRERIRQIHLSGISKLRSYIHRYCSDTVLDEEAKNFTKINNITRLSNDFNEEGIVRLLVAIYSDKYKILRSKYHHGEYLVLRDCVVDFHKMASSMIEYLKKQTSFIDISDVSSKFKISEDFVKSIIKATIHNKEIALKTKKISYTNTITRRVEIALEKEKRYMSFTKLMLATGLSRGQIIYALARTKRIICIGKNNYALVDWGYLPGNIGELAIGYLKEACEPMTQRALLSLLSKQRMFSPTSMMLALSRNPDIQRLNSGHYVLRADGYEDIREKNSRRSTYPINLKQAILSALNEYSHPISIKEIIQYIQQRYDNQASQKYSSINVTLHILIQEKKIKLEKRGRNSYYQLTPS